MIDRSGLPKLTQTYFFFSIDKARVHDFRTQLSYFIPLITTTAQARSDRDKIAQHKKSKTEEGAATVDISGVTLAFSHKGLLQVSVARFSKR